MKIAFCYESVLPERGGCETYIADLARRLVADRHEVHVYACRWNAELLPTGIHYHKLPAPMGGRFVRPWHFASLCERALQNATHQVSIGFNKTWGQDILYPLGGLHVASAEHNIRKDRGFLKRGLARLIKKVDPAHWSFSLLEKNNIRPPSTADRGQQPHGPGSLSTALRHRPGRRARGAQRHRSGPASWSRTGCGGGWNGDSSGASGPRRP